MAPLCEVRGHLDKAYEYIKQALETYQTNHGPDSPKVAAALSNLANIIRRNNSIEEAGKTYQKRLAIALKSVGVESPLYVKIKGAVLGNYLR